MCRVPMPISSATSWRRRQKLNGRWRRRFARSGRAPLPQGGRWMEVVDFHGGWEGYFRGRDRIWISHDKSVTSVWRRWNSCLGFGGIIMNHSQRFWKINIYHIYPDWIDGLRFTFLGHTPGRERRDGLNRRQQLVFGATWNSNKWLDQQKMRT